MKTVVYGLQFHCMIQTRDAQGAIKKGLTMKINKRIIFIASVLLAGMLLFVGCGKQEAEETTAIAGLAVQENLEFGGVDIKISIDDFNAEGFSYGDSVDISFSNGYTLEDIPYYNGFYTRIGEPVLAAYPGYEYVYCTFNCGDNLWEIADLTEDCTVDFTLKESGAFMEIQEARDIHYKDEREEYDSDVQFANFRSMVGGSLKEDYLYRSASPCDNQHNRAHYVDGLCAEAGIAYIMNLADTEAKIEKYMAGEDFASPYFLSLYESGNVILLGMGVNYKSEEFAGKLAAGLTELAEHQGPYLFHCTEGKDRTGFVCMLLEALAGASYDEILTDYMTTYDNYYRINPEKDNKKYETIIAEVMDPMLEIVAGEGADLKTADLAKGAEEYLKFGGMDDVGIAKLKEAIMK